MIPNSNESLYTVRIIIRFYRKKMIRNAHKTKTTEKNRRKKGKYSNRKKNAIRVGKF